jgi:hypothetical protein
MFIEPIHVTPGIRQGIVVRPAYYDWVQSVSDLLKCPAYVTAGQAAEFMGYPVNASRC